ncbi:TetR/AcrR family transcriptional regulator [Nakamurella alba]|uniref:TetR/AcrR family transcriptional regulator n=1 Tax=Nakamurella alba TaxID=2665158 RepID=UPI0012B874BE|nr:TetR/AcrR family transcriptional regulator [Nakamurella alba]
MPEVRNAGAGPVANRKRESILQEATRLFGAQGYAGTTMRDIATAVGVLPGSLYTHIQGKEELLLEVVETGIARFLTLEPLGADQGSSPVDRFREFIAGHVLLVAENPEWSRVINHQWRFLTGEKLRTVVAKRARYQDILESIVEDGRRTGDFDPRQDVKVVLLAVLGALNWTPEWYNPHGPDSALEVGHRLADSLLGGLVDRPSEDT